MIHITLPLVYYNFNFYNELKDYLYLFSSHFKIEHLNIDSFYGTFPFAIWNGGVNLNIRNEIFMTQNNLQNFITSLYAPIRLDFSNIFITNEDLTNGYQNLLLKLCNEGNNFIELSDFGVLNYIKENFPDYNFILSKNAHFINPFTTDIINTINEQNVFYLIELPDIFKRDIDFLKNIKLKNNIEITISNKCNLQCYNLLKCPMAEQEYITNFSEKTIYSNCDKINNYNNINEIKNEIQFFNNLGFSHFKIDTPPIIQNNKFLKYLIHNLIKEEYQLNFEEKIL